MTITRDKEKAKNNHVGANYPGQLIGQDIFYIGCLKEIGRVYYQVAYDSAETENKNKEVLEYQFVTTS